MDLRALRALVLDVNIAAHGQAVTVTVPGEAAVETDAIWITPPTEDVPAGGDFRRKEMQQVIALRRSAVPTVPRGTIVVGAPHYGDEDQRWKVDGTARIEVDRVYVVLVPAPE